MDDRERTKEIYQEGKKWKIEGKEERGAVRKETETSEY